MPADNPKSLTAYSFRPPISSKTPSALRARAWELRVYVMAHPELNATDIGWSLATTRSAFEHRGAAVSADRRRLLGALVCCAAAEFTQRPIRGRLCWARRQGEGQRNPGLATDDSES
ncbi:hypothetical protein ACFWF7_14465 [Nocardia sp. NPDC060256]|uniref:CurL C-terminal domain-containing protein n=1 Tax=unclassified Nocardia TaxID=2637762 RepID=UPI00365536FD